MGKDFLLNFLLLSTVFFLALPVLVQAPNLCSWRGYANISGTAVSTSNYITAHNGTKVYNATILSGGYYIADVQGDNASVLISFKICGVNTVQAAQAFCSPDPGYTALNLSISALANGASCTYSCACSGGYCCSGATEYTDGSGTGTCQGSACAAATTTTAPGGGGTYGGGGAATTTTTSSTIPGATTTTTTTLPPAVETETVGNIGDGETGSFNFTQTIVTDIQLTAANNVTNPQVTVSQSSTKPSTVVVSASNMIYGYLTITKANLIDADVSSVKIRFKIEKAWLTANRIDETTVVLSRYSLGTWTDLPTTKINDDGTYVYFEATSPGLSVFAINGEQRVVPTFWQVVTYIDNYYTGQITFWTLLTHISDYYSG